MDKVSSVQPSIRPLTNAESRPARVERRSGSIFAEVLQAAASQSLRFSNHAQERLRTREIQLTEQDAAHLAQAVEMASAKGAKESLILLDDLALVVNVRNKVVITALERGEEAANVFTHIDSAILLRRGKGAEMI